MRIQQLIHKAYGRASERQSIMAFCEETGRGRATVFRWAHRGIPREVELFLEGRIKEADKNPHPPNPRHSGHQSGSSR